VAVVQSLLDRLLSSLSALPPSLLLCPFAFDWTIGS